MAYKYTHLISQNIAPSKAKKIGVYDSNGKKICSVPLGRLAQSKNEKLYSFGLLSDVHLADYKPASATNFENALSCFEEQGALFCCHCGDLTDLGFWHPKSSQEGTFYYNTGQFDTYKSICQKHNIPVYGCCGNHESAYGYDISGTYTDTQGENPALVVNNLEKLREYTGQNLTCSVTQGNDVFIFVSQPSESVVMSDEALKWLYETLEANRNERCFLFVHSYIEEDSGDPLDLRENGIFEHWDKTKELFFMSLLTHYQNTVWFHGHSHMKFKCQELDECANYTEKNGFKSVHIPSCGHPRDIINNESVNDYTASEGYLVDVYEDFIVLNGMDFKNNNTIPIGVYKIDTALNSIEPKTFADDTGIITA